MTIHSNRFETCSGSIYWGRRRRRRMVWSGGNIADKYGDGTDGDIWLGLIQQWKTEEELYYQ